MEHNVLSNLNSLSQYSNVQINAVKIVLIHATFDHVYLDSRLCGCTSELLLTHREMRPRRLEGGVVLLRIEVWIITGRQRPEEVARDLKLDIFI